MSLTLLELLPELIKAAQETLIMLSIGLLSAVTLGTFLGTCLYIWSKSSRTFYRGLYFILGGIVNIVRSFPFVILMITVIPFTRTLVGSSIGPVAAAVPLSIAAVAYFARIVESALIDVPLGVIEAAQSMGATPFQIVFYILYVEARSSLILGFTTLVVSFLSYSAAAGIVGGGGMGDLAIRYGYYRFQTEVMIVTTLILIFVVQIVQFTGTSFAKITNHR